MLGALHHVLNSSTLLDTWICEELHRYSPSGSPQSQGANREQLCEHQVGLDLLHPLMGCNRKWSGLWRAGEQEIGICSMREGGREGKLSPLLKALERNCCCSGEASWSNLPMSPMSPQFPMLFCQEYKPFPDYLSKQAGKGNRKIWRSQCQLYGCSLRKPVAVSVSETPVNGEAWGKGWEEDGEIWGNGES